MIDDMAERTARIMRAAPLPLLHWLTLALMALAVSTALIILCLAAVRSAVMACGAC